MPDTGQYTYRVPATCLTLLRAPATCRWNRNIKILTNMFSRIALASHRLRKTGMNSERNDCEQSCKYKRYSISGYEWSPLPNQRIWMKPITQSEWARNFSFYSHTASCPNRIRCSKRTPTPPLKVRLSKPHLICLGRPWRSEHWPPREKMCLIHLGRLAHHPMNMLTQKLPSNIRAFRI